MFGELEIGWTKFATTDVLGFTTVPFKGVEFQTRVFFDDNPINQDGVVDIRAVSPLAALTGL